MKTLTKKAWFVVKVEGGFMAKAKNLDTGAEAVVGPWGRPLPTVAATRAYIKETWNGGNVKNMPGSVFAAGELGEPDDIIVSRCHFDLC